MLRCTGNTPNPSPHQLPSQAHSLIAHSNGAIQTLWYIAYSMLEANGLPFGRTFGNSLAGLALTVLREENSYRGWEMVGDW
jgi:hypothetical protein